MISFPCGKAAAAAVGLSSSTSRPADGRKMLKVAPAPISLCTLMCPPLCWMMP